MQSGGQANLCSRHNSFSGYRPRVSYLVRQRVVLDRTIR